MKMKMAYLFAEDEDEDEGNQGDGGGQPDQAIVNPEILPTKMTEEEAMELAMA
jgi:hypothetical protein